MRYCEATVTIQASPNQVRAVLSDVTSWPSRDNGLDAVGGAPDGVRTATKLTIRAVATDRAFPYGHDVGPAAPDDVHRGLATGVVSRRALVHVDPGRRRDGVPAAGGVHRPAARPICQSTPDLPAPFEDFAQGLKARSE